jgi:hypothetical protein
MDDVRPEPPFPFRIRIGVTGHRHLPHAEELAARIDEALDVHVIRLLGSASGLIQKSARTPLAFTVLTPLAEGADRLVAEVTLKRADARIEVVLPLTVEDYIEDFATDASRAEFRRLLARARRPISLREAPLADEFEPGELVEARERAYEDVGRHVVRHCDVLLALWGGETARGKGGTADTVAYARSIGRPVVVIDTDRPFGIEVHAGDGIRTDTFAQIDAFNAFDMPAVDVTSYVESIYRDLFDNESGRSLSPDLKSTVRRRLLAHYARASTIAKRSQSLYMLAGSVTYSFAALAVATVAMGALFLKGEPLVFVVEFLVLVTSFVLVLVANHRRAHRRWLEHRFLAERLRVASLVAACGLEVSSLSVPPQHGTRPRPGGWMEMVFAEAWGRMPTMTGCAAGSCVGVSAFVKKAWIEDQITYHEAKARRTERLSRRIELGGLIVFSLALTAPLLHLVLFNPINVLGAAVGPGGEEFFGGVLTLCALVLPAIGAALGGIRTHREYSRLAKRSEDMVAGLQNLHDSLERVRTPKQLDTVIREAEQLMLSEVQDWVSLTTFSVLEYVA